MMDEKTPLVLSKEPISRQRNPIVVASIIFAVTALSLLLFLSAQTTQRISSSLVEKIVHYDWTLYNENYKPLSFFTDDTFLKYTFLDDYDAIIEPSSNMIVYLPSASYHSFEISLCNVAHPNKCRKSNNGTISVPCDPFEEFDIKIEGFDDDGAEVKLIGVGVCMYVRREIRSLVESDLSATMDAMATLWTTTETDGQELYGSNFHSHSYFLSAHYYSSAAIDGDYSHGGQGFLPQHAKLSNMFELAMQAVDPSVSLPYWDFTIDANYSSLFEAFIFQESVFGTLTRPSDEGQGYWLYSYNSIDDGKIPDGRWANLKVDTNDDYTTLGEPASSPYGFLRAPWSANPSKYILRFPVGSWVLLGGLPSCADTYMWIDEKRTLYEFLQWADVRPHTPTHWTVGSMFGCDILDDFVDKGWLKEKNQHSLCVVWGIEVKNFYRSGYIETDTSCVADAEDTKCAWTCVESKTGAFKTAMKSLFEKYFTSEDMDDDDWDDVLSFFCTGDGFKLFYGDHREPASASDPSFWPIHPALDRALQAKFLADGFTSLDWVDEGFDACDGTTCNEGGVKDEYADCCHGHFENDGFPDFLTGNKSVTIGQTNRQYVQAADASSSAYGLPYIYDSFSWGHCSQKSEEDIDTLLTQIKEGDRR